MEKSSVHRKKVVYCGKSLLRGVVSEGHYCMLFFDLYRSVPGGVANKIEMKRVTCGERVDNLQ